MAWSETNPMKERVLFIDDLEDNLYSMTELCGTYGISRKTGYKWAERYVEEGVEGLRDRSRAPHNLPPPHRGARGGGAGGRPPNDVWTIDFKGEFRTGDQRYCYPLTVADQCSRYVLGCKALLSTETAGAQPALKSRFRKYGLPRAILSDNGSPFSSQAICGLSRLSVWWIKLGIEPLLIQPGHPEQNGVHERMHRTLKAETARPPAGDLAAQQQRFDAFMVLFNEERPHEALGQRPPAELYEESPRAYPERLEEIEYPGHFEVRRVQSRGELSWRGLRPFVSEVLMGEPVGLEEVDDGVWSLYFGPRLLARFDEREGCCLREVRRTLLTSEGAE